MRKRGRNGYVALQLDVSLTKFVIFQPLNRKNAVTNEGFSEPQQSTMNEKNFKATCLVVEEAVKITFEEERCDLVVF